MSDVQKSKIRLPKATLTVLIFLLPVFVISLYQHFEQQANIERAALLDEFNNAETQEEKAATVEKILAYSEQLQQSNPDDIDGWLMLTNSYLALERYPDALNAVENLYRLKQDDPSVMLRYADILSRINNGYFKGKPNELINKAMQIDPENQNGLWLSGLAAIQRGELKLAIDTWERLTTQLDHGSESEQKIQHYITLARNQLIDLDEPSDYQNTNNPLF